MLDLKLRNKKVLVMGLGLHQGGVGTVKFLVNSGARVTVTDLRSKKELAPSLHALSKFKNINFVLGKHRRKDFADAELIVKNPGVCPDSPFLKFARKRGVAITSDIGIFFKKCPARIIGITGTRGKSTCATLIYQFLRAKKKRVFLAGNIRKSVLEILPKLRTGDWIVLELSSFQLYDLAQERMSPAVAVITNFMSDHLNWHRSLKEYWQAKTNIFKFQKKGDWLFIPAGDKKVGSIVRSASAGIIRVKLPLVFRKIVDEKFGKHYRDSVGLATAVGKHFGVSAAAMRQWLGKFKGLEGRQQEIGSVKGVHFVNDTTATTPEAAIAAIERFYQKAGKSKLILIAGGSDKGLDFRQMAQAISKKVDVLVSLSGTATKKLQSNLRTSQVLRLNVRSMERAVKKAFAQAKKEDWVVLSPGAASFGLFLNEFDRGEQFIKAVYKLRTS